ncbi:hypothetical protein SUGI_0810680 [Cryptomeria japonica]|nr:hypothetical protein SUGI_0810680 [Cryptomeria japonica]
MAVNSRWWTKETVAVVTGANKGIGFEIVRQFAENVLTVILTARDANRGLSAVKTLHDQGFNNVVFHELDIQKPHSVSDFGRWMKDNYGGLDILVNNAAIYGMFRDNEVVMQALQVPGVYDHIIDTLNNPIFAKAHKTNYELSKNCIEINYYGTKRITEELLPLLRPEGRIVNVSSEAGLLRVNNAAIYGMMRDYEAMMQALQVSGVYDHIFNNPIFAKAHKTSYELSKNCIEINYYGTKRITEELLPLLRPEGRIVNVSSEAGLLRVNNAAIYGMMRDYEAMMQALRVSGVYDHIFNNPVFAKAHKTSYELSKNCIEINYYGTKRITEELLPLLRPEGRIVNVSSEAGLLRFLKNDSLRRQLSDVSNITEEFIDNMVETFLEDIKKGEVEGKGVVQTDMSENRGSLTVSQGAESSVMVALLPPGGPSGQFYFLKERHEF